MQEELYTAYRFFKSGKRPQVMKRNMTLEKVQEFCNLYPPTKNSFVGYNKN